MPKNLTPEGREKIIQSNKKRVGDKNPRWVGNNFKSKSRLHDWIRRRKPKPEFCKKCKIKKPMDLASRTGKLTRNPKDYDWLCRSCHMKLDIKLGIRIKNEKTGRWIKK